MFRRLMVGVATAAILLWPAMAAAAAVGDAVVGKGSFTTGQGINTASIHASSGPNGESPTGTLTFVSAETGNVLSAHVTCVRVVGNAAIVIGDRGPGADPMGFYIEDRTSAGLPDRIVVFFVRADDPTTNCTTLSFHDFAGFAFEVHGNFIVIDR